MIILIKTIKKDTVLTFIKKMKMSFISNMYLRIDHYLYMYYYMYYYIYKHVRQVDDRFFFIFKMTTK